MRGGAGGRIPCSSAPRECGKMPDAPSIQSAKRLFKPFQLENKECWSEDLSLCSKGRQPGEVTLVIVLRSSRERFRAGPLCHAPACEVAIAATGPWTLECCKPLKAPEHLSGASSTFAYIASATTACSP